MSTIKDNLVQIREKLDTENTQPSGGGVLEEVKKIRQVLDTDNVYPDGGGLAEEICAIRELVQDGKGGGGFKTAKVRITYDDNTGIVVINLPHIDEQDACIYGAVIAGAGESRECTVPLGENGTYLTLQDSSIYYLTDLEGSIENQMGGALITGDCSVVIRYAEAPK